MENVSVPELRVEAKGLGLERYSKRRKQALIQWISYIPDYPVPNIYAPHLTPTRSNIPDYPVPNIYAPLLTPTRYVHARPRVEVNKQRRREIREIEEILGLRNRP